MISNHQGPSEALDRLLHGIGRLPLLDASEEAVLAREAASGDGEAASRLVQGNLRRLVRLACRFRNKGLPLEDLIHEGAVGLLEAAKRFEPSHGVRFFTYGAFLAQRAMVAALARSAKTVRLPRAASARARRVRRAREGLLAHGAEPTPAALARVLGVSPSEACALAAFHAPFEVSLDEPVDAAGRVPRADTLSDPLAPWPDARLLSDERHRELREALARLPARERLVLAERHGLDGREPRTLRELGSDLRLSKERVRQLEERAKAALHVDLSPRLGPALPASARSPTAPLA